MGIFTDFNMMVLLRLVVAGLCGGAMGFEREMRGRPAGLKTFTLVAIGSALVMIANEYIYKTIGGGDTMRLAAQVISGIGFLGAGTILVTRSNEIKGLTTAATLWVTAAVGIAIGAGFYFGGLATLVLVAVLSQFYRMLDRIISERSKDIRCEIIAKDGGFLIPLRDYFKNAGIQLEAYSKLRETIWRDGTYSFTISIRNIKRLQHNVIFSEIEKLPSVIAVNDLT